MHNSMLHATTRKLQHCIIITPCMYRLYNLSGFIVLLAAFKMLSIGYKKFKEVFF